MPNIASVLKTEIARVARKELRAETQNLKKTSASYRAEIAALKRRVAALEQGLKRLGKAGRSKPRDAAPAGEAAPSLRFSAKGLASQRRRLGLSAADCGLLVGASSLSIYKWESGQARPRAKFITALAGLRTLGKKEAAARLETLGRAG
jgi:DNA-binding transcriptional regulator YiaG